MKLNAVLTCVLTLLAILSAAAPAAEKPTLLLNITSGPEDLHKATMALQLGGHAIDDGRNLAIFLNVRAPVFAAKDCSSKFAFAGNPPVKTMLADLIKRGAKVHVCPHCMEVMGVTATGLINGAQVTGREKLFGLLGPTLTYSPIDRFLFGSRNGKVRGTDIPESALARSGAYAWKDGHDELNLTSHWQNFIDCGRSRAVPCRGADHAYQVAAAVLISLEAYKRETKVRWDPRAEEIG